jgi:hypothetical protein
MSDDARARERERETKEQNAGNEEVDFDFVAFLEIAQK